MKETTKQTLLWLEDHLKHYRINLTKGSERTDREEKFAYEALHFIKTIPEIESHLCNGGYIQDRNGKPCCHGDKIKFKFYDNKWMSHLIEKYGAVTEGKLQWNPHMKAFGVDFGDGDWLDFTTANDGVEWFEKVE